MIKAGSKQIMIADYVVVGLSFFVLPETQMLIAYEAQTAERWETVRIDAQSTISFWTEEVLDDETTRRQLIGPDLL